jgi:hypothetical protein
MICIICHDDLLILSKICICNDSVVCVACLNMLNFNKVIKCPNCRRLLTLERFNNIFINLKYILFYCITPLLFFTLQLFPINYILNDENNEKNENCNIMKNRDFQYYIMIFSFLIIQPINYYFYSNFFINRNQYNLLSNNILLLLFFYFIGFIILSLLVILYDYNNIFSRFFWLVIIPSQYLPFLYIIIKLNFQYILNIISYIKRNSAQSKILVKNIIKIEEFEDKNIINIEFEV